MKRQDLIDLLVWVRDYLTEYHLQPEHEMVSEIQDAIWALDEGGCVKWLNTQQDAHVAVGVVKISKKECRLFGSQQVPTEQKATFTVIRKTVEED